MSDNLYFSDNERSAILSVVPEEHKDAWDNIMKIHKKTEILRVVLKDPKIKEHILMREAA